METEINLSEDKIISLDDLIAINAQVRGIDKNSHSLDGAGQINEMSMTFNVLQYLPPIPENRKDLLLDILENAQTIEDKEERATYIGLCINAIHAFNDGNGRTSRYAYFYTIYDGEVPTNIEEQVLENTEGRKIVDLNPQRIKIRKLFNDFIQSAIKEDFSADVKMPDRLFGGFTVDFIDDYSPDTVICPPESGLEAKEALYEIFSDRFCGLATVVRYLIATNKEEILKKATKHTPKNGSFLSLDELAPGITADDIALLYDTHVRVRDEYISFLQKIFNLPEYADLRKEITDFYRPKVPVNAFI